MEPVLLPVLVQATGVGPNTLRVALVFLLQLPLNAVYAALCKTALQRHVFSLVATSSLTVLLVSPSLLLVQFSVAVLSYLLAIQTRKSRIIPWIVTLINLGTLCVHLLWTQVLHKTDIDISAPLMMQVVKMSTFAWAVHDSEVLTNVELGEFLGYAFFHSSFLVGPAFDFAIYRAHANGETPFDAQPPRTIPALRCLALGIATIGFHLAFLPRVSYETLIASDAPIIVRILHMQVAGLVMRCKYYGAWKIAEAACIQSGIGYDGKGFTGCSNVDVVKMESATSVRAYVGSWNIGVNRWLRACVYERLGVGAMASAVTWLFSAFWHGFHPGYYVTFVNGGLATAAANKLRRNWGLVDGWYAWFFTQMMMNYVCAPFPLYTLQKAWIVSKSVWFYGHFVIFVVFAMDAVFPPRKRERVLERVKIKGA